MIFTWKFVRPIDRKLPGKQFENLQKTSLKLLPKKPEIANKLIKFAHQKNTVLQGRGGSGGAAAPPRRT